MAPKGDTWSGFFIAFSLGVTKTGRNWLREQKPQRHVSGILILIKRRKDSPLPQMKREI